MHVNDMEEAVKERTGESFSFWHQRLFYCHSYKCDLKTFIGVDSYLFSITESELVFSTIDSSRLPSRIEIEQLDLSRHAFISVVHFVKECTTIENQMFRKLILREVRLEESHYTLPVVQIIRWFCPNLTLVDITGCSEELRYVFLNQSSDVEIVDYLDPRQILNYSDVGSKIMELLEQNALPPAAESQGWTLLHTAALVGDSKLCQYLLESRSCNDLKYLGKITAFEIAFALHHIDVVDLMLQYLQPEKDTVKMVALGLLSNHISESNILTSFLANDQLKKLEDMHNVHCNPHRLFEKLCSKADIDFKRRLLEEILLKMHRTASSDCKTMFSCWTETTIFETVRFLCQEIDWTPEAKVMSLAPYLMYVTSSPSLVRYFLENGATVNSRDSNGNTPLFYAVCRATGGSVERSKKVCRLLLERKADPNAQNSFGETPLIHNCTYFYKTCQICPTNATSKCQSIWLESSATKCSPEIWQFLLKNKAKSKCRNKHNKSLLYFLLRVVVNEINSASDDEVKCKSADVVSELAALLCQNGATLTMRDDEGNSIVHEWAQSGLDDLNQQYNTRLADIFFDKRIVDQPNDNGEVPLHLANSWLKVKLLIQWGANPNAKDHNDITPLSKLVSSSEIISFDDWTDAIKLGMDPWLESNGDSVFRQLAKCNRDPEGLTLIKASAMCSGPDRRTDLFEKTDSDGNTLLHIFSSSDNSIVEYLLENGAKVGARNRNGQTPLHLACLRISTRKTLDNFTIESAKNTRSLLKYHARIDDEDNAGYTCAKILESHSHKDILESPVVTENTLQFKWKNESRIHHDTLLEVAHGRTFKTVETYHYHHRHIGKGCFGLVFPGIDTRDKKEVALKRIEKQRLGESETIINREIDCLVRLRDCEKVLRYYNCASNETFVYIVLELMDGTLTELLEKYETSHKIDLSICVDIAAGIQYIHRKNILHRDLKPNNVLYRQNGPDLSSVVIKISDFGLGKIIDSSDSESVMHSKAGATDWMAPELKLVKGKPKHTKASDIYSCGLVMSYVLHRKMVLSVKEFKCPREAKHLLEPMLSQKPDDCPNASEIPFFPVFWDENKKRNFINNVSEELQVAPFADPLIYTLNNKDFLRKYLVKSKNWNKRVPAIYKEMVSSGGKGYNTASFSDLIRFIRNTHVHPENLSDASGKAVFEDCIFFNKFPTLVITVYDAVKQHGWEKKPKIGDVLKN